MTPEKDAIARQLIKDLNEKLKLTVDVTSPPCPVSEISAMATKFPDPLGYDTQNQPKYTDPIGQAILNRYAENVKEIIEKQFSMTLEGLSREMSLNLNYDALKLHQDHFTKQYAYLSHLLPPIPMYILFQDLTLIDWQMAQGTFSATMVQDGENGDRFLMVLFPGEVVGKIYTEPMVYHGPDIVPTYPGPITFSPHSAIPPILLYSNWTVGSWKGSRVSTSTRAVVKKEEIDNLCESATYLPINRPTIEIDKEGRISYRYTNGVMLKEYSILPSLSLSKPVNRFPDQEAVTIYEVDPQESHGHFNSILEELGIEGSIKGIFQLVKRDTGFSRFGEMDLDISSDDQVVVLNRSILPEGYQPFNIAEDCTISGMPWIQLYHFPTNMAMIVSGEILKKMALTPIEELIYRDHKLDAKDASMPRLMPKIISALEVIVVKLH
jgi:hypothetical protein